MKKVEISQTDRDKLVQMALHLQKTPGSGSWPFTLLEIARRYDDPSRPHHESE